MNSCPCRKQFLSWDCYRESHELAPLQVLSRVRLKNIPSAALNLMLSKQEGGRRVGTNTDKPFASVAYWRQSTDTEESKDFEPAEDNYPSRILSATTMQSKTPLNYQHNPKDSFHPPASQLSNSKESTEKQVFSFPVADIKVPGCNPPPPPTPKQGQRWQNTPQGCGCATAMMSSRVIIM